MKQKVDISKENALEKLNDYILAVEEVYQDIKSLEDLSTGEKQGMLRTIKEKYKQIKNELTGDLKQLEQYECTGIASRFYKPALQDMLHNSTLIPVNQVALKNLGKLHHSLYDIKDYARYWINQLKGYSL